MKPDCFTIKEKVSDYIDDVLSEHEKEIVKEHLSTCAECEAEYNELCGIVNDLKLLPTEPLPPDFFDSLYKKLPKRKRQLYFTRSLKGLSSLAAGLILLLLIRTGYYGNINRIKTAYVDDATLNFQQDFTSQEPESAQDEQQHTKQGTQKPSEAPFSQAQSKVTPNGTEHDGAAQTEKAKNEQPPKHAEEQPPAVQESPEEAEANTQTNEAALFYAQEDEKTDVSPQHDNINMYAGAAGAQEKAMSRSFIPEENEAKADAGGEDTETEISPPVAAFGFSASSHDMEVPSFSSVIVTVTDFEEAASVLKERYNAQVTDGIISLKLNNEDFQQVMNLMLKYGARVQQLETEEPLTTNECIIVPDKDE